MGVFVSFDEIRAFGISKNTIKIGCYNYRKGKAKYWINRVDENDKRRTLIDIDSIPPRTQQKYNIPTGATYILNKLNNKKLEEQKIKEAINDLNKQNFAKSLENAFKNDYLKHFSTYKSLLNNYKGYNSDKTAELYAKNLAYWLKLVELTGGYWVEKGSVKVLFDVHLKLKNEVNIIRNYNTYPPFCAKLKQIRRALADGQNPASLLISKKIGKSINKKTNEFHTGLALEVLSHPKAYTYPVATKVINHHAEQEGQCTVSESWVKNLMNNDPKFRNLVLTRRKGEKYFSDHILPYQVRNISPYPANVWMIDGTPLQFYCKAKDGRLRRLNLFTVIDVCTRKIVGFDISFTENKDNVKRALKSAILLEGHLPAEIVSDNFSANKTAEIKELQELLRYSGCQWRHARVGNARDKTYVERFFGVFQLAECSLYHDYLGEGITAKRDITRPSKEYLIKVAKKQGYIDEDEMKQRVTQMVLSYNKTTRKGIGNPVARYKDLPKPNAVLVDEVLTAKLFWNKTKNTIRNAMVQFTHKGKKLHYEIYDHEQKLALTFQEVTVRFDPQNLDKILIFDYDTDNFITACKPVLKTHIGSVEATEQTQLNMYKNQAKKESYKNYIENQIQMYRSQALQVIDKDYMEITDPLDLKKQTLNTIEDQTYLQYYYGQFGIDPHVKSTKHEPIGIMKTEDVLTPDEVILKGTNVEVSKYQTIN